MIPAGVERRLRGHVDRVLRASHVPSAQREELAEELFGHLAEAWKSLVNEGLSESVAADQAVRDFGTAERIARDLTRTYRGRFWASTIGVLLPVTDVGGPRPRIAWWLGASLWVYGVLVGAMSIVFAAEQPPVAAVLGAVFGLGTAVIYVLAAAALARRQRWGLDMAIVANVIGLVSGTAAMMTTTGLISLNVVFSGLVLAFAYAERRDLGRWVRRSRSVDGALAVAILAVVLGGALFPVAAGELPDPTQAGQDDLHARATIACSRDETRITFELRWDHRSFLPGGLGNLTEYGDLLLLENSPTDAWEISAWPQLVDAATGAVVAQPAAGLKPNWDRLNSFEGPASQAIQVGWDALEAGRTYRADWIMERIGLPGTTEPFAGAVEYIHADRFRWEQAVDCYGGRHEPFVSDWP